MIPWLLAAAHAAPAAGGPAPDAPAPARVEVVYQELLDFPPELTRPVWKTNRLGQALLQDQDGDVWVLDPAGRALRPAPADSELKGWTFPLKYLERWSTDWVAVRDGSSVPLASGPDFTGAYLVTRWGADRREALVRVDRKGLEVWSVTPPTDGRDLPSCLASVPESCLASGLEILREHAGDEAAAKVARSQIRRACDDGVVRACFLGVALDGGPPAALARTCMDGDAPACAAVAGQVHAAAQQEGSSSKAGERMLEHACDLGVPAACSEAARVFDERDLPHNALLMLDRACVSGDRDACDQVEDRRDRTFAAGIAKACQKDPPDAVGCLTLAQFLEEKPIDDLGIDAFEAWRRACGAGEQSACRSMGPYVDRWGVDDPRVQSAATSLLSACEAGAAGACVGAAHLLVRFDVRDPRYGQARELYVRACDAGEVSGCLAGARQAWGGVARRMELPDAETLFRKACDAGSAEGCGGLGDLLARERGGTEQAVVALEKGCEGGSPSACTRLGALVEDGRHVALIQPADVFARACADGEPEACWRLGRVRSGGEPTTPGTDAYEAYTAGCEGGNTAACEAVGMAHLERGTHYEAGVAAGYFDDACESGRMEACHELGLLYRSGLGVARDPKRGRELLVRAGELEPVRHLRLGARIGFLNLLGVDVEAVLPIPVGPAISVGGDFSYLPGSEKLSMVYVGPTARIYPSHGARGLYGAFGWHQFRINAGGEVTTNAGFNGRVGVRVQKNLTFGGVEIGLASVDAPRVQDIIRPIPLVVPVFGVSGGVAFL
jgi:TPR repeat protein